MPEAMNFLLLRAEHDIPTTYSSYYAGLAINEAVSQGYKLTDLRSFDATKENLAIALDTINPLFFLGSGHGQTDRIAGQNEEIILQKNYNENWMQDRIVYLMSCLAGRELGPAIIDAGGIAFIGYDEEFWWTIKPPFNPAYDPYAKGFFEAAYKAAVFLLRGYNAIQAFDASISKFNEWIDYWTASRDSAASLVVANLLWDRDNMLLLGEREARILTGVQPPPPQPANAMPIIVPLIGLAAVLLKGEQK